MSIWWLYRQCFGLICFFLFLCLEVQENTEALKTKMSELRIYCDLLLEQVNKLKESPLSEGAAGSGEVSQNFYEFDQNWCRFIFHISVTMNRI